MSPSLHPTRWSSGSARPRLQASIGATDCHHHIYDSRFPAAPLGKLSHGDALVEDYLALAARLGIERHVVVQPSLYGDDNRLLLQSLQRFGDKARGIAVIEPDAPEQLLRDLDAGHVRGIRINANLPGGPGLETMEALAARIAPLGWHLQLAIDPALIPDLEGKIARLPCPVVFDHGAYLRGQQGLAHSAFAVLARLLETGNIWLKLSAPYIGCEEEHPAYPSAAMVGRAFVKIAPERMLWGSDWPHPTIADVKPDGAALFDLVAAFTPDAAIQGRILVDNPRDLYGF